ncbi:MAG: YbaK/EbsC family protein [Pseudomonadota bacterium]
MGLATSLERYLIRNGVSYEVVAHRITACTAAAAHMAQVSTSRVAKSVVLKRDNTGYLLAVLPASSRVLLGRLHHQLQRALDLASENEVRGLFWDCAPGAVPPFGPAYGLEVIVDDGIWDLPYVYFEGGDHVALVKVRGDDFRRLLPGARHGRFSRPAVPASRSAWAAALA